MRNRTPFVLLASMAAVALASCSGVDDSRLGPPGPGMDAGVGGSDAGSLDATPLGDAGPARVDAGEICGGSSCAPTERCCGDPTCGLCFARGTSCPPIDCGPDAGPPPETDAGPPPPGPDAGPPPPMRDAGPPPTGCGGMTCLPGFTCCGTAACGRCIVLGIGCTPPTCRDAGTIIHCGGLFDPPCGDGMFCDNPECSSFGGGICQPRPDACSDPVMRVCGCDRTTYDNACEAHRARTSVAHAGAC